MVDTVTVWSHSYRVLQPPSLVNKYAALPSLHVGFNLLVGLALYRATTRRGVRFLGVLSPLAMVVAVVLTANHYVVDAAAGMVVALIAWALAGALGTSVLFSGGRIGLRGERWFRTSDDVIS